MEIKFVEAIKASPGLLSYGSYALFLDSVGEFDRADECFQKALQSVSNPKVDEHTLQNYTLYLGFYGAFLETSRADPGRAEKQYLAALEYKPNDPLSLGNYAVMLHRVRKDYKKADVYYKRAIQAHPNHASILGKYANFLKHVHHDYEGAEQFYLKAIAANPKHADSLGNYAVLLHGVKQDYDKAQKYYQQAIAAEPEHTNNLFVSLVCHFVVIDFLFQLLVGTTHYS